MANVPLAKPSLYTGAILTSSGSAQLGTSGSVFYYKIAAARLNHDMHFERTTGDGDSAQTWEADYMPDFDAIMTGWMVAVSVNANVLTFISSFLDSTKNPLTVSCKINLATGMVLTIPKALILAHGEEWVRARGVLPMSLRVKATDSNVTLAAT